MKQLFNRIMEIAEIDYSIQQITGGNAVQDENGNISMTTDYPEPMFVCVLYAIGLVISEWFWTRVNCQHRYPDYVCEDWSTPDSGGMAGYCKLCGYSFNHSLY